jgi:hypothetical protein
MGRGFEPRETALGNVLPPSLDDHFGDGVGRSGPGPSITPGPRARRTACGLGIPHLWNASLRLPLVTPGLAQSAWCRAAAPRVVVGTDRADAQLHIRWTGMKGHNKHPVQDRTDALPYQAARRLGLREKTA